MKKASRIVLGAIFVLSALAKLSSMEGFELYIFSFEALSFDISSFAARLVVISEMIIGIGLMTGQFYGFFKKLTAVFLTFFSLFLVWRAILGDTDSCHCMGDVVDMSPVESLVKNAVLALLLLVSWSDECRQFRFRNVAAGLTAALSAAAVFVISPPDVLYRIGRSSDDVVMEKFKPVADSLGLAAGRRVICLYSATCEHCRHSASKMAGIIRRHSIPADSVSVIFMQTHVNQDSVATEFFRNHGGGLALTYSSIHPYVFLPMTNGSMPLILLYEDGMIIKEYDYLSLDEKEISDFMNRR